MAEIVGIDPGLQGGIARIACEPFKPPRVVSLHPMPVRSASPRKGQEIDAAALGKLLLPVPDFAAVEQQTHFAAGNQGAYSIGKMLEGFGMIRGVLDAYDIRYKRVPARTWQTILKAKRGETKSAAIVFVRRMFGDVDLRRTPRCTTVSDGLADALCIAVWGAGQTTTSSVEATNGV
jgi:hypothetical protein